MRVCAGIRCTIQRADVMSPSQPSFCTPGQAAEELVGDVLAEPFLAERRARDLERLGALERLAARRRSSAARSARPATSWILPRLWSRRVDLEPRRRRASPCATRRGCRAPCPTAPPSCRRRSSRCCRRCTTPRPTSDRPRTRAGALGRLGHALRDDAGLGADRRHRRRRRRAARSISTALIASSFSVLMTALDQRERHRAAGVAGAAAARNDRQAELDAAGAPAPPSPASVSGSSTTNGYSTRQSVASVTCETRAQAVEADVVLRGDACRAARSVRLRSCRDGVELRRRTPSTAARAASSRLADHRASRRARRRAGVRAASRSRRSRWCSASISRRAPARVVEQVVLQVRVALHDPDVAQHLVEHARRAPGAALVAQRLERVPGRAPEQPDDDLAIGERRVVVGNLAQARRGAAARLRRASGDRRRRQRGIHGGTAGCRGAAVGSTSSSIVPQCSKLCDACDRAAARPATGFSPLPATRPCHGINAAVMPGPDHSRAFAFHGVPS